MREYRSRVIKYDSKSGVKYRVDYAYKTPDGTYHKSCKRGFSLKREADAWVKKELPMLVSEKEQGKVTAPVPVATKASKKPSKEDMLFSELVEMYMQRSELRRKETTCYTKSNIIDTWILPTFKDHKVYEITVEDIENWQDMILKAKSRKGKPLANTYIATIRSQFTAIMNYAVMIHNLPFNPLYKAEMIGDKDADEQPFWELEEYLKFRQFIAEKPKYFYAFEVLFWTGMRMGEMLALKLSDIDLKNLTIRIDETFTKLNKKELLTDPKNKTSFRTILIPEVLGYELSEYLNSLYDANSDTRIFSELNKSGLHRVLDNGIAASGITDITIHGLRHSHISLCSSARVNAREAVIAERVGHSRKKSMTRKYTHVYPADRKALVEKLNEIMEEAENV